MVCLLFGSDAKGRAGKSILVREGGADHRSSGGGLWPGRRSWRFDVGAALLAAAGTSFAAPQVTSVPEAGECEIEGGVAWRRADGESHASILGATLECGVGRRLALLAAVERERQDAETERALELGAEVRLGAFDDDATWQATLSAAFVRTATADGPWQASASTLALGLSRALAVGLWVELGLGAERTRDDRRTRGFASLGLELETRHRGVWRVEAARSEGGPTALLLGWEVELVDDVDLLLELEKVQGRERERGAAMALRWAF